METKKPQIPELVPLRSVDGGELVSCAEHKGEILFVPDTANLGMDIFDKEDDKVIVFNVETGEARELPLDTTVIWHAGSKLTVVLGGQATRSSKIMNSYTNYSLRTQEQLEAILDVLNRTGKIQAIKYFREATGHGLKEAKYYVDAMEQDLKSGKLTNPADHDVPF
jgi:hypothetical protein